MSFDFEDILASAFGRMLVIALFLTSGVWVGSLVGAIAIMAGERRLELEVFLSAPLLLINVWLVLNVAFLAGVLIWIFVADGLGYLSWGVLIGVQSFFVMLGFNFGFRLPPLLECAIAWAVWLTLLAMLETGVWLTCQWRRNVWAREIAALSAENAMILAQQEMMAEAAESPEDADLR